jgi:excisionase family DNA binding protein
MATQTFPEQKVDSTLLDIEGAARFLGLTHWQVRGLLADGELRCIRVGRKLYMRRTALLRWAETSEEKYKAAA